MTEERNTAAPETEESRNFIFEPNRPGHRRGWSVPGTDRPHPVSAGAQRLSAHRTLQTPCASTSAPPRSSAVSATSAWMTPTPLRRTPSTWTPSSRISIGWALTGATAFFYGSDYFEKYYEYAVELIKKGLAYVCELTPEEFKANRGDIGIPATSPYRDRPIEENLRLFEKMKNGEVEEGKMTLRAKIDLASGNLNLRDPIIYRIRFINHHRQGYQVVHLPHVRLCPPHSGCFPEGHYPTACARWSSSPTGHCTTGW